MSLYVELPGFKKMTFLQIAGESKESVVNGTNQVEHIFGHSIKQVLLVQAQVRPGKEKGHEHFVSGLCLGFRDRI